MTQPTDASTDRVADAVHLTFTSEGVRVRCGSDGPFILASTAQVTALLHKLSSYPDIAKFRAAGIIVCQALTPESPFAILEDSLHLGEHSIPLSRAAADCLYHTAYDTVLRLIAQFITEAGLAVLPGLTGKDGLTVDTSDPHAALKLHKAMGYTDD
jgi:hypothetical protein